MTMLRKLLLADDSLTIQKVVELVLAHENFEIKAVNDGEQALEALGTFMPDIVLADIEMPKLNGYQLCQNIKNNPASAHIPVVLLAGAFEPFDEEYAKSVGSDDYIIKPFESQELISKIKSLLLNAEAAMAAARSVTAETPAETMEFEPSLQAEAAPEPFPVEEPKMEEEVPLMQEEKAGDQAAVDEDYDAKVALTGKGFEDELIDALKQERSPESAASLKELAESLQMPSQGDISEIIRQSVDEKVSGMIANELMPVLSSAIRASVEQTVAGTAPSIIATAVRESVREVFGTLRSEIDAAISKIVPEVAEALIRKEIEKITSEL